MKNCTPEKINNSPNRTGSPSPAKCDNCVSIGGSIRTQSNEHGKTINTIKQCVTNE